MLIRVTCHNLFMTDWIPVSHNKLCCRRRASPLFIIVEFYFYTLMLQGDTDITIPMDVPPGRREVAVNKSLENGGLGISIKGRVKIIRTPKQKY